jgi:spermidine/putrescine transport system substrate-binding protein
VNYKNLEELGSNMMLARMLVLCLSLVLVLLVACGEKTAVDTAPAEPTLAEELIFYNWKDYMPQSVLDAFTAEYGVPVRYVSYDSEEEAAQNVAAGIEYDIVILPPELLPQLIAAGHLAEIDYRNVPNFRNISANFRDLIYDPENRHSIIFHWGTTGLLVRTDLVEEPVTRWADLWDPRYAGRVGLWPISRSLIPIALKSLGYPANSVNPAELEAALERLIALEPDVIWWPNDSESIVPLLVSGEAIIAYGWAYDAQLAAEAAAPISYILPEEGTFLWSDNFVIPASSRNKYTAELFINFMLRPEISAQIVNESYYPMANEAALPLIDPDILADPVIYPPGEQMALAEIIMPLNSAGESLFAAIWDRFLQVRAGE